MLPLLASAIPALAGLVAGPAAAAFGIGSAVKQAHDNPGSQTWLGSATDELLNGGSNRINQAESQAARAQQQAQFEKNIAFQQEQFDYQKQLNQTQMLREDTAAQRQVADMRAAGLSPLAQFSGASTGSLSGSGFSGSSFSPVVGSASPTSILAGASALLELVQNAKMNNAQIDKTRAETAKIIGDNKFGDLTFDSRVQALLNSNAKSSAELKDYLRNSNYMREAGITPGMPEPLKILYGATALLGLRNSNQKLTYNDLTGLVTGNSDYQSTLPDIKNAITIAHALTTGKIKPSEISSAVENLEKDSNYYRGNIKDVHGNPVARQTSAEQKRVAQEFNSIIQKKNADKKRKRKENWDKFKSYFFDWSKMTKGKIVR